MSQQVVEQKSRGFVCITAHPDGCAQAVRRQRDAVLEALPAGLSGPKRVLVVGSSTGYGLSTRIAAAWGFGAGTLGIFLERPGEGRRTATAGYYNSVAFSELARKDSLYAGNINGDAYADETKKLALETLRNELGPVDLVVYSLASPRRTDPRTGETYQSVLKPIGQPFHGKTVNFHSGEVSDVDVEPASDAEVEATIAVMGGGDWNRWIEALLEAGLLAEGARTLAYSYVGPGLTWPIYRNGTIGAAKKDLEATAGRLNQKLAAKLGGGAWVSVNKAVVTQASAAIPVVPLYMSLLFKVMKDNGTHEGCIEQMRRLCFEHLADGKTPQTDAGRLIRLDDLEMNDSVQAAVESRWPEVTSANVGELSDLAGYRHDFNQLFGFDVNGVDYTLPTETERPLE